MSGRRCRSMWEDTPLRLSTKPEIATLGGLNQQMHMIVLAIAGTQLGAKVCADLGEDIPKRFDRRAVENTSSVFRYKDQMNVHHKNVGSTTPYITLFAIEKNITSHHDCSQGPRLQALSDSRPSGHTGAMGWRGACRL